MENKSKMPLKLGDIVQNLKADYSQEKGKFSLKPIPAKTVGRVKKVYPGILNLVEVKFPDHPLTKFRPDELVKVRIPR